MSGIKLKIASVVLGTGGGGGGGGTSYYVDLIGKPQINSVTLTGNKSSSDLGLASAAQGTKADNAIPMPSGGSTGQVLTKTQGGVGWADASAGGTTDYSQLSNKPQINGVTLSGNKTSAQLGINSAENAIDRDEYWNSITFPVNSSGYELPCSVGVMLALKRAKQMSEIQYVAKSTYAVNGSTNGGTAGQHTGLPYSSVKELFTYIGFNVSLETFMTAVNSLKSVFYTEDISAARSRSGYGFSYNGTNCGTYFGTVCSSFVCYVLGLSMPFATDAFKTLFVNKGWFVKVKAQSARGVHLLDVIHWVGSAGGHGAIVTSVKHDSYGNVTNIELTDGAQNNIRKNTWTSSEFNNILANGGFYGSGRVGTLYRCTILYENLTYNPSEFVSVMGESNASYIYNNSICTYLGNKPCVRKGFPMYVNFYINGDSPYNYSDSDMITFPVNNVMHCAMISTFGQFDINSSVDYNTNPSRKWYWIAVSPGSTLVLGAVGRGFYYAITTRIPTSQECIDHVAAAFASGYTARRIKASNESAVTEVVPADGRYLAIQQTADSNLEITIQGEAYDAVQLYKGNVQIGSDISIDPTDDTLQITSYIADQGEGLFKARLTDGTSNSEYTEFEIIDTETTVEDLGDDTVRITFSSSTEGIPQYVSVQRYAGGGGALYEISDEDKINGYVIINPNQVYHDTYGTNLNFAENQGYIRVVYLGEYGSAASVDSQIYPSQQSNE